MNSGMGTSFCSTRNCFLTSSEILEEKFWRQQHLILLPTLTRMKMETMEVGSSMWWRLLPRTWTFNLTSILLQMVNSGEKIRMELSQVNTFLSSFFCYLQSRSGWGASERKLRYWVCRSLHCSWQNEIHRLHWCIQCWTCKLYAEYE